MFGDLLGKIISTPVRLANVPVKVVAKAADAVTGDDGRPVKTYDPLALDEVADAVDQACSGKRKGR